MWELMNCEELTGIKLTESLAMDPAASVSAIFFAHPKAVYFSVGKICEDQVCKYINIYCGLFALEWSFLTP